MYRLDSQNKNKNKNKMKRKEGLKEEDRRDQAGERLIFYIQRTVKTPENVRSQKHQRTSENSLNIREHQTTSK